MATKIDKKIVGYKVKSENEEPDNKVIAHDIMNEDIPRPELLLGSTYKIKTPQSEHAMYITINDIILNQDTDHEERRPYEVFINSKNMEHYQWVVALTRVISAVFRKGGDVTFLVDEMKAVFDPKGGYFKRGGVFMPSLVAEIGCALENHMKSIGMIVVEVDEHQQKFIAEKRKEFESKNATHVTEDSDEPKFPDSATVCTSCNTKAVVLLDGCKTCLSCCASRCG